MMPRLGDQSDISIKVISKPRHEFQAPSYMKLNMPKRPAIMIGAKIIVAGADIEEEKLITAIKQQL
jgi:hypothetical protein